MKNVLIDGVYFAIFISIFVIFLVVGLYVINEYDRNSKEKIIVKAYMDEYNISKEEAFRRMIIDKNSSSKIVVLNNNTIPKNIEVKMK